MKLLKLDDIDCFCGDNLQSNLFENLEICIETCKKLNINVFVIYKDHVFYRKQSIKECVFNMSKYENTTMYILLENNIEYYHLNDSDRVKYYTSGIYNNKNNYNYLSLNRTKLIEAIKEREEKKSYSLLSMD